MAKNVPVFTQHQLTLEAQRRLRGLGISVTVSDKAQTAYTNGKTIVIPVEPIPMSESGFKKRRGLNIHEVGHNLPENRVALDILKDARIKKGDPLGPLYNMAEDARIERGLALSHKGDAKALSDMHDVFSDEQVDYWNESWKEHGDKIDTDKNAIPCAVSMLQQVSGSDWNLSAFKYIKVLEAMGERATKWYNTLVEEGWQEKFVTLASAQEAMDLAKALKRRLYPEDEEQEEARNKGSDEGSSEDGDDKDGDEDSVQDTTVVKWSDLVRSAMLGENSEKEEAGGHVKIVYDKWDDFWVPHPHTRWEPMTSTKYSSKDYTPHDDAAAAALANQVRRYIMSQRRLSWQHNLDEGELDGSALYKLAMPGYSESKRTVFMEPKRTKGMNTAITLLVDCSGSMNATDYDGPEETWISRHQMAAWATHRMLSVFERSLHVPCEVLGYSENGGSNHMFEIKPFAVRYEAAKVANGFVIASNKMGGNADADAILAAHARLMARKEQRKILLVLSDGEPSDSYRGDACFGLHKVVDDLRKSSPVQLYGIGIMTDASQFYGKKTRMITTLQDMDDAILTTLQEGFSQSAAK